MVRSLSVNLIILKSTLPSVSDLAPIVPAIYIIAAFSSATSTPLNTTPITGIPIPLNIYYRVSRALNNVGFWFYFLPILLNCLL